MIVLCGCRILGERTGPLPVFIYWGTTYQIAYCG
jgi:hypothetical protein